MARERAPIIHWIGGRTLEPRSSSP